MNFTDTPAPPPMYPGVPERNREAVERAADATEDGYIGPWLCAFTNTNGDQCGYLRGHEGLHSGPWSSWCDPTHPCMGQRERIDFDKHPRHWVCPNCSGGAA